ncbi:TetR/AcrR family transcriptional regulator [Undibacterium sp. 14-3-2]|uniref:TetR/AcrR family transcriptional regulator n=1 Tax=Undibacterium sp. 14-3-2 TaxID=2800129 RepID=UPI0019068F2A|nr:TetR/AcrR family transcriptional regulator [Undibacterium sp. 14-3-2]MBK1889644.1 TetR/AcrR family transcriptional regulator [Undibacterium sp. 14-3-2]
MQHIDPYRKKPLQSRSEVTIDAIFEAGARILQTQELAAFNTNAVAKLAGVSIGTLYQYFPNKNAILIAMAQRELNKVSQTIIQKIDSNSAVDDRELARTIVRALLKAFGGRQRMRKVLLEALIANGLSDELTRPIEKVIESMLAHHSHNEYFQTLTPISLYVTTRALIGTIRSAVMEQSAHLGTAAFEDELVRLFLYCAPHSSTIDQGMP